MTAIGLPARKRPSRLGAGLLLCVLIGWIATALAQSPGADIDWPSDTVIPKVATSANADQQYSLYLPPGYPGQRQWPLLVILDARGRGESSLRLALDGARANGWVVLSSYQSRSDTNEIGTLRALQALLGEALQRFAIDRKRIYLAGLSGTAKTLWTRTDALAPLLAGMIGCGGGRPPELGALRKAPAAFFGMAGTEDFNYFEMRDLDADLADADATHRLLVFPGPHGWPQAEGFSEAIDWLDLMAMRDGRAPRRAAWIEHASPPKARGPWPRADSNAGAAWINSSAIIGACATSRSNRPKRWSCRTRRMCNKNAHTSGDCAPTNWPPQSGWMRGSQASVHAAPPAVAQRLTLRAHARNCASMRCGKWLRAPSATRAESARRRLERILAFTSFYLPEQFMARGDRERTRAMLELSIAIDPTQPRMHWRLAQLHAETGNRDAAFAELKTARALGDVDLDDLQRNPAWESLRSDPRWDAAIAPKK